MNQSHIYTRNNPAHAWKYEGTKHTITGELERDVNTSFGVETLLVPVMCPALEFLDSAQAQGDFN